MGCQNVLNSCSPRILGWSSWSSSHSPDEGVREVRICPRALGASSTRLWSRGITSDEEDDGIFWSNRLLHMLLWPYPYERQFYESNFCCIENDLCLLDARLVEADALHEAAIPGVHGLSRSVENPFHGPVRVVRWIWSTRRRRSHAK